MHFDDLEPCLYDHGRLDASAWAVPLRAIGWLEATHNFTSGDVPVGLVVRLAQLVEQTRRAFPQYAFRGVHECSLCVEKCPSTRTPGWSQENLIIPGEGQIFAAPGGVVHYIEHHRYQPPDEFINAALTCPDCDSPGYLDTLRRTNRGLDIPIEPYEAYVRRVHAIAAQRGAEVRARASGEAEPTPITSAKREKRS
jgi:hypothetical protein